MLNYSKTIFLTDSHGLYVSRALKNGLLKPFNVFVKRMNGATVSGLKNPNSFTAAAEKFESYLQSHADDDCKIIMQLGEVDCGILLWLKSEKNSTSVQFECDKTIADYISYVKKLNYLGYKNVVLTSATIPTITDDDDAAGEVKSLRRKKVKATYRERTDLTFYFNESLKKQCKFNNIDYIDLTADFIDEKNSLCNPKFRNKNPEDHHMEYDEASIVWAKYIKEYLFKQRKSEFKKFKAIVQSDTYIKKLKKHSKLIPDKVILLEEGNTLKYSLISDEGNYLILRDVYFNDVKIDDDFIFILKKHLKNIHEC